MTYLPYNYDFNTIGEEYSASMVEEIQTHFLNYLQGSGNERLAEQNEPLFAKLKTKIEEIHQKKITDMTSDEIQSSFSLDLLRGCLDYKPNISLIFKVYETTHSQIVVKNRDGKTGSGIPDTKIYEQIGEPPWVIINNLLAKYKFHYRIKEPVHGVSYAPAFVDESNDKKEINFSELSSGEKIIVTLILWIYNDKLGEISNVLLLDEPDAHLNPSMSKLLIDVIKNTLVDQFGIQVIMTTHHSSTVARVDDDNLFWMEREKPIRKRPKSEIIPVLSDGIMTYQEATNLLQCIAKSDCETVIFTEGKTDKVHIESANTALHKEMKFCIHECGGADKLKQFLVGLPPSILIGRNKKIIGIFDYDKEGLSQVKDNFEKYNDDDHILKSKNADHVFAITLPMPESLQQLKEFQNCPIEFLYDKALLKKYNIIKKIQLNIIKIHCNRINKLNEFKKSYECIYDSLDDLWCYSCVDDGSKAIFAKYIKDNMITINFDNFQPLFDKIKLVINDKNKTS